MKLNLLAGAVAVSAALLAPFPAVSQGSQFLRLSAEHSLGFGRMCNLTMILANYIPIPGMSYIDTLSGEVEINANGRSVVRFFSFRAVEQWRTRQDEILFEGPCDRGVRFRVMSITSCVISGTLYRDCADIIQTTPPLEMRPGLARAQPPQSSLPARPTPSQVTATVVAISQAPDGHPVAQVKLQWSGRNPPDSVTVECAFRAGDGGVAASYGAYNLRGRDQQELRIEARGARPLQATSATCTVS